MADRDISDDAILSPWTNAPHRILPKTPDFSKGGLNSLGDSTLAPSSGVYSQRPRPEQPLRLPPFPNDNRQKGGARPMGRGMYNKGDSHEIVRASRPWVVSSAAVQPKQVAAAIQTNQHQGKIHASLSSNEQMSDQLKNRAISENQRVQRIVQKKNVGSIRHQPPTITANPYPSPSRPCQIPGETEYKKCHEDGYEAKIWCYASARRKMMGYTASQPQSARLIASSESKGFAYPSSSSRESWQRSTYLPGPIHLEPSFGLYLVPVMTAMDVLCSASSVSEDAILDEIVDFFESYGFAPISNQLDKFWLPDAEMSKELLTTKRSEPGKADQIRKPLQSTLPAPDSAWSDRRFGFKRGWLSSNASLSVNDADSQGTSREAKLTDMGRRIAPPWSRQESELKSGTEDASLLRLNPTTPSSPDPPCPARSQQSPATTTPSPTSSLPRRPAKKNAPSNLQTPKTPPRVAFQKFLTSRYAIV